LFVNYDEGEEEKSRVEREAYVGEETGSKRDSFLAFLRELPILIITAIIVAWLIRTFIVQPFYIPSGSMEPTLYPGDRVLVNKFIYRFKEPKLGEIVVFEPPHDIHKDFIKRIIATEGEIIEIRKGQVFIDGKILEEPYAASSGDYSNYGPVKMPKDNVFVMGDNRANSMDSRMFGPMHEKYLVGEAFLIYWPPHHIKLLP